jgi:hypothetical protein
MQRFGDGLEPLFLAITALWIVTPALAALVQLERKSDF